MTPEQNVALRAEFKPEQIGKLPKVNCRACVAANKREFGTTCAKHRKINCDVCSAWISEQHIHLDYVGHAVTTDRLLEVDPEWTWEPFALDADGLPKMRGNDLWIRMTIAGVTRPGVGDGPTAKEAISDAIRNAAMRFGVALSLWAKGDLRDEHSGPVETAASASTADAPGPESTAGAPPSVPVAAGADVSSEAEAPAAISATRMQRAKSRVSALIAVGISVADERAQRVLPPLNDKIGLEEFELFCEMLDALEAKLTPA